jgi:hypothetical protein
MYYDSNFNNPNVWTFEPDTSRRAFNPSVWKGGQLRLAWQASSKNKIGISWNDDVIDYTPSAVSLTTAPEAAQTRTYPLQRQTQIDWASPVNNRLLLEAGVNRYREQPRTHARAERHDDSHRRTSHRPGVPCH